MLQSTFGLFGIKLVTAHNFHTPLLPAQGAADVELALVKQPPVPFNLDAQPARYISPITNQQGNSILQVYALPDVCVLHFPEIADFYLFEQRIELHLLSQNHLDEAEHYFLSTVMAFWLELHGVLMLHVCAISWQGRAAGFLAESGVGKSTLLASLMRQGAALLSDDLLAVRYVDGRCWAAPGFPALRMLPAPAQYFLGDASLAQLRPLHARSIKLLVSPGKGNGWGFQPELMPLTALYFIERKDSELIDDIRADPATAR